MKFCVSILLTCVTLAHSLEILDQLKSSAVSFHQQIHAQIYTASGRIRRETENALPTELGVFELAVNDIFKDLATIEQTFNSVSAECQARMPTTPGNVRNAVETAFHSCGRNFYNELVDAQRASEGFFAIMYGQSAEQSLKALESISRTRISPTETPLSSTIDATHQEYIRKILQWDNVEATELFTELYVYQDKLESAKANLQNCLLSAKGRAGADIGDIFISLWDC